jgi:hypothetical protein
MEKEIGKTAGQALSTQGDLSLTQLKNQVKAKAPSSTGSSVAAWWVFLAVDRLSAHKINGDTSITRGCFSST